MSDNALKAVGVICTTILAITMMALGIYLLVYAK